MLRINGATHGGCGHSDDMLGTALLVILATEGEFQIPLPGKSSTNQSEIFVNHKASQPGDYDADIIFTCSRGELALIRTRDDDILKAFPACFYPGIEGDRITRLPNRDFIFDVHGKYDPLNGELDHHQAGFEETQDWRGDEIGISSVGLIWRHHGMRILQAYVNGNQSSTQKGDRNRVMLDPIDCNPEVEVLYKEVHEIARKRLFAFVDAVDTGSCFRGETDRAFTVSHVLSGFNPLELTKEASNQGFAEGVCVGYRIIGNVLEQAFNRVQDRVLLKHAISMNRIKNPMADKSVSREAAKAVPGKDKILVLTEPMHWDADLPNMDEGQYRYVVFPTSNNPADREWMVQAVPVEPGSFTTRLPFPENWAGCRRDTEDKEKGIQNIQDVSGIENAKFCHPKLFIAGAEDREGCIKLAETSLRIAGVEAHIREAREQLLEDEEEAREQLLEDEETVE